MGVKPAASTRCSLVSAGFPEGTGLMLLLLGPGTAPKPGPGLVQRTCWGLASRHQHLRGQGQKGWCWQHWAQVRQGGCLDGHFWGNDIVFILFLPSVHFNRKLGPFQNALQR